ncbi:MAG: DUF5062 domain-containing protein [Gammaproteobacteria bacterium HGW-Gammaproteobacteria-3]|nr:MAG: DUF5062 domain-containing protein [Gammaproteobacteria bacterium HGW-Gammaproteobacteria-3]
MTKLKNESQLVKKALEVAVKYAKNRGYAEFAPTHSAQEKIECIYRLLVQDRLIQPLAIDQENAVQMKHKLALWITRQLPADHPLLK